MESYSTMRLVYLPGRSGVGGAVIANRLTENPDTSVLVIEAGVLQTITASKEVVLSAGVIGTPQILLRSGIGPARTLSDLGITTVVDNPSVGENFTDHAGLSQAWYVNSTDT
ncbi:hypothetical protein L218DRAFT_1078898 [Marasmius fiardii PR-910]|nr:hypothetical protein L218DRAFT_1078898 [Marasmius fiardii PR-910]